MKPTAWLLVPLSCLAIFLFAQDQNNSSNNKSTEMTGWVCNAKCVHQNAGAATCDPNCSQATGPVVFVSHTGQVLQISNQAKAQPMAGKECKMKAKMDPSTGALDVENMVELRGP